MKRSLVILTILTVLTLLFASCGVAIKTVTTGTTTSTLSSSPAVGRGYVNILVTDAPPSNNVTSIMVTVASVSVHMAGAEETTTPPVTTTATTAATNTATTTTAATTAATSTATTATTPPESSDEAGKWITIPISGPNPFDLLKLQGINEVLGTRQLQAGRYTQIRMELVKVEVSLGGGPLQEATLPSGELKFIRPFDVIDGVTTDVKLDFDAQKSVNVTGNGKIMVKPVVKLAISNKSSSQLSSVTGTVSTVNALASTVSIMPTGQTQPVILGVNPQTMIILNENEVTLAGLAALPAGSTVTASYYPNSLKAIRIEVETPQTTATTV
jgi:hypothetical protein